MDIRQALTSGTRLRFPGMSCIVGDVIGCGSNAIVYEGSYTDQQIAELHHRVLIKELFPFDPEGSIRRGPDSAIWWDEAADDTMRLHRESFLRGNDIHVQFLNSFPGEIEGNLNTYSLNNTLYSVLGFSGGRSMDRELEQWTTQASPLTLHLRRILGVLDCLERFHKEGYLHLDISPDNILLIGDGRRERVSLIDYNSVQRIEELRSGATFYYSIKEGYTAPEIRMGSLRRIGYSADLYSVAAVFFRCALGRKLTILETSQCNVPSLDGAPILEGLPKTALSLLRRILNKGLHSMPGRRYQSTEEMRRDLEELQDRIDGKGITPWALYESGRRSIMKLIEGNPALGYLKEPEAMYPLQCVAEGKQACTVESVVRGMAEKGSVLLVGGGGMGKTTALLSVACRQKALYSSAEPALAYIPLRSWRSGEKTFIKDRLLETMRFKPETASLEMARHELSQLLSTPSHTRFGDKPRLLLLLDGMNEAVGETAGLFAEIEELLMLPGVRLLITSRTDLPVTRLNRMSLCPLRQEDVQAELARNGLLMPDSSEVACLLETPLMLSLYIRTAMADRRQLFIHSERELLDDFFAAMIRKTGGSEQEVSGQYWVCDAAVRFVLPALARMMKKNGGAASEPELLTAAERCWRSLTGRTMRKLFPEWAAHLSEIRGEARNFEEWYRLLVHEILWRRMGLILHDSEGHFSLFHNLAESYFLQQQERVERLFRRQKIVLSALLSAAILIAAVPGFLQVRELMLDHYKGAVLVQTYESEEAGSLLQDGVTMLLASSKQCVAMERLLSALTSGEKLREQYQQRLPMCESSFETAEQLDTAAIRVSLAALTEKSGARMPWSYQQLDVESFEMLLRFLEERTSVYRGCVEQLGVLLEDEALWAQYGESYRRALSAAITADIKVLESFMEIAIKPERERMSETECEAYLSLIPQVNAAFEESRIFGADDIQNYEQLQSSAWNAVLENPAHSLDNSRMEG